MSQPLDERVRALLEPKNYGKGRGRGIRKADAVKAKYTTSNSPQRPEQHLQPANTDKSFTYNPRDLLNPRGGRRQAAKLKSDSPEIPSRSETNDMTTREQIKAPASNGRSRSMLEGLYGVEQRTERPAKRIKTDATDGDGKPGVSRTTTAYRSGGGIVGDYMRGPKDQIAQNALSNLVDLTNDDERSDSDDDLKVLKSVNIANEQEVCFGMIYINVHAHAVPQPPSKPSMIAPNQWPLIKCTLSRKHAADTIIEVADPVGFVFGRVASEVAAVLAPVMDGLRKIRTQARLTNRPKKPTEIPHDPCSGPMKMMINIYGRRGDVEKVGRVFGQHNIWFKNPMASEAGYPICNPHASRAPIVPLASAKTRANHIGETRTLEEATSAVSKLFDHFANTAKPLAETEPPPTIMTELLQHQKQALTFMLQKEAHRTFGPTEADNSSLWRKKLRDNGSSVYEEVVSGITVKDEPEQVFGGLLADVMGLGKTLEALSLVAATIDEARSIPQRESVKSNPDEASHIVQSGTTLIVTPVSTVKNWEDQIHEHLASNSVSYYVYHGPSRLKDVKSLSSFDIVISTYNTIAIECSKKAHTVSPIQQIGWFRIILDEAHTIREPKASQSQAMYSLNAQRRWCLTGTPIQNRIDDLGSLTRFLRLYPYDTTMRFTQYIRSPALSGDVNFLKALRVFVDSFTLRRNKDRVDLPRRKDIIEKLQFSKDEKMLHEFFKNISRNTIKEMVNQQQQSGKSSGIQHSQVLRSIMTLRLICAHGRELLKAKDLEKLKGQTSTDAIDVDEESLPTVTHRGAYETLSLLAEADMDVCRNCDRRITGDTPHTEGGEEETTRAYMLSCLDLVCKDCFGHVRPVFDDAAEVGEVTCPYCSLEMSSRYIAIERTTAEAIDLLPDDAMIGSRSEYHQGDYTGPHTKTYALLRDLNEMRDDSSALIAQGEPPLKGVVFSEFTSHLDLLERALKDNDYQFVRIDGTMSLPQRRRVLDQLNENDEVTVLLASIKAAGQGLNLTAASRAFIMEPLWNPAAEAQAVDRIYRIGQKREVLIKRYQMQDSIELQIIKLQEKKQKLADLSLNKNHQALSKREIRAEHMKDLFDLFR